MSEESADRIAFEIKTFDFNKNCKNSFSQKSISRPMVFIETTRKHWGWHFFQTSKLRTHRFLVHNLFSNMCTWFYLNYQFGIDNILWLFEFQNKTHDFPRISLLREYLDHEKWRKSQVWNFRVKSFVAKFNLEWKVVLTIITQNNIFLNSKKVSSVKKWSLKKIPHWII